MWESVCRAHILEWNGRVIAVHICYLACFMSSCSHSHLSVQQNSFSLYSHQHFFPNALVFASLMDGKWHLIVIFTSLIPSKVHHGGSHLGFLFCHFLFTLLVCQKKLSSLFILILGVLYIIWILILSHLWVTKKSLPVCGLYLHF